MHIPILLRESLEALNLNKGNTVVDATTNRGGHAIEIAKNIGPTGTLVCIDLDSQALKEAKAFLEKNITKSKLPKIFYINDNFRNIKSVLKDLNIKNIDGLLADLGVSSEEIDDSGRGFTFQKDEPLFMTLSDNINKDTLTAVKIVNTWEEENIADIIYYYGDERYAKRIAKNICEAREAKSIKSTKDLIEIISYSVPEKYKHQKIHFATKTFQALRIAVNDELKAEEDLLYSLKDILNKNRKACIITFHSGEDRMLKRAVKADKEDLKLVKFLDKKDFLVPSIEEIKRNPRSRSAKLRVVERI
ncbi:MAG: S-adenosyl-methyltransferase MraW, rRNA (cytosine1402-N4)-methyltransferase [Candidatus Parcubacteria bacterium]|jgi:16S rRNA (cytosine1402-N4)-methyltransferase